MNTDVSQGKPWSANGQNLVDDLQRALQRQLTTMSVSLHWGLLAVIMLVVSGLWQSVPHLPLLAWSALAVLGVLQIAFNNSINVRRKPLTSATDSTFVRRNVLSFLLLGLTYGSLPLVCALWGNDQANWYGLIITMALLTVLVLILSTSHRVFFAALLSVGSMMMASIAFSPLPRLELLALGALYLAALASIHNVLFQMQLDRVRSSLRSAADTTAMARTLEHHDPLTGLYNRAGLDNWLAEFRTEARQDAPVLLTMGNVMSFTEINALYGTSVADGLLTQIAARLVHQSGGTLGIARLGGAEFMLVDLRPFAVPENLLPLLASLENEPFQIDSHTLAIGIRQVWVKGSVGEMAALFEHAQLRLQALRAEDSSTDQLGSLALEHRRTLVNSFHHALVNHQIQPWFQPIVDCRTHAISGWEALARWEHPGQGQISPDNFLAMARVGRQLPLLTRIMLKTSARFARELNDMGLRGAANIHVNITASELSHADTLEWMEQILAEVGVAPEQIIIELSEKDAYIIDDQLARNLLRMQQIGMLLAIDDFGTGYANLAQLLDLPAHAVKIDKRFVDKLPHDKASAALIRAMITLASGLDMQTIAEGVESDVQLQFLCESGCNAYQGFRSGHALPYSAALNLARDWPHPLRKLGTDA